MSSPSEVLAAKLKSEGKFEQFKKRRAELVADGLPKTEAYAVAVSEFGAGNAPSLPAPPPRERERAESPRPTGEVFAGKSSSLREDYQWVYENIAVSSVEPEAAPSSGAWGLLEIAKHDPKAFYVEWMRMVGKQVDENAELKGFVQDAARSTSEIASMLRSLGTAPIQDGAKGDGGEPEGETGDVDEGGV